MTKSTFTLVTCLAMASASLVAAQWPKVPDPTVPHTADGKINYDAPAPRTPDGHPDLSGIWMRAESGPPRPPQKADPVREALGQPRLEFPTDRFPYDPSGPPVASFGDAGKNMEGGLPFTKWGKDLKDARKANFTKDNPDSNCLPMGFLEFFGQPQPRQINYVPGPQKKILFQFEANGGLWPIYLDGRKLPPQGDPQPWWYGYSVGHWEGDDLVVESNNLRGAEDGPSDGWLDINGSPYSNQATFVHHIRRPTFGHLQIDETVNDPKAYTHPFTVRVDQRLTPDEELIEDICNENQQFGRRIKLESGK
jgi:hypothetical protein